MFYIPCAGNKLIRIADGFLAPIAGKEKISPCTRLSLHNVLHVSKIFYNLFSISKIILELNCKAMFLSDSVFLQDLSSGKMIDAAQHSRGFDRPPIIHQYRRKKKKESVSVGTCE